MRVLEIGKFYPPQRGGMETHLHDLCTGLVRRGHGVRALVTAPSADPIREELDGVEVRRAANWGTLASVPVTPGLAPAIRQSLGDFHPDVAHLHLPHPVGAVSWLMARSDIPLVVTYHSDIVRQKLLGTLYGPIGRALLGRAHTIHVTSEALMRTSHALAPFLERCRAVPLGVDTQRWAQFSSLRVQEWMDRLGSRFLLFVGRLVYYKGLDVLFEALRETNIRVAIVGTGPMGDEWQTLSRVLGLRDRVEFLGDVSDDSLAALYRAAHGFVLPSVAPSEAFGIVQLEAMAAGLPIVVARASEGVASVHVENETALMVPPRDPLALRRALVKLWSDDDLAQRLGANGRQRVRAFYELDHSIDRIVDLLARAARRLPLDQPTGRNTAA